MIRSLLSILFFPVKILNDIHSIIPVLKKYHATIGQNISTTLTYHELFLPTPIDCRTELRSQRMAICMARTFTTTNSTNTNAAASKRYTSEVDASKSAAGTSVSQSSVGIGNSFPWLMIRVMVDVLDWNFLRIIVLEIILNLVKFGRPWLLQQYLLSIQNDPQSIDITHAIQIAVALFLCTFSQSIIDPLCNMHSDNACGVLNFGMRCVLFSKMLRLSPSIKASDSGKLTTIPANDPQQFAFAFMGLKSLFSGCMLTGLSCSLMITSVGQSGAFGAIGIMLLLIYIQRRLFSARKPFQQAMNHARDERQNVMNEFLHHMRVVKTYGWSKQFALQVQTWRKQEMSALVTANMLRMCSHLCTEFATTLMAFAAFGLLAICTHLFAHDHPLLASLLLPVSTTFSVATATSSANSFLSFATMCTIIHLFKVIEYNLSEVMGAWSQIMEACIPMQRMQWMYQLPEVQTPALQQISTASSYNSTSEPCIATPPMSVLTSIVFREAEFQWERVTGTAATERTNSFTATAGLSSVPTVTKLNAASTTPFKLHPITAELSTGSLTLVVGPVAAGKSSFLQAIIGEMSLVGGSMQFHHRRTTGEIQSNNYPPPIAYCCQQPWLQNASIRDNIVFGQVWNANWYEQTLHACALHADIGALKDGDCTVIGERGVILSGGQKARIGLARAVYFNAQCTVLDDVLSALDAHTARYVFEHAIVELLLNRKKSNSIVILATHQTSYWTHAQVDLVYYFEHGRMIESGNPIKLIQQKGSRFARQMHLNPTIVEEHKHAAKSDVVTVPSRLYPLSTMHAAATVPAPPLLLELQTKPVTVPLSEVKPSWRQLFVYIQVGGGMQLLAISIVSITISNYLTRVTDSVLMQWSSSNSHQGEGHDASILHSLILYASLICCRILLSGLAFIGLTNVATKSTVALHDSNLAALMHAKLQYFETTPVGVILAKFGQAQRSLDTDFIDVLTSTASKYAVAAFILLSCVNLVPSLIWFLIPSITLQILTHRYVAAAQSYVYKLRGDTEYTGQVLNLMNETMNDHGTIRAFQQQQQFSRKCELMQDQRYVLTYNGLKMMVWLDHWMMIFASMNTLITCLVALHMRFASHSNGTHDHGGVSLGEGAATLCVTLAMQAHTAVRHATARTFQLQMSMLGISEGMQFHDQLVAATEAAQEIIDIDTRLKEDQWPQYGDIKFRGACMKYRSELPLVIRDLNVHIEAGLRVAIVGRTGAGKSSFVSTLFRFVELYAGEILIDDVNIARVGLELLRSEQVMTLVPQETVLFKGTIAENLDPWKQYSARQLKEALEDITGDHEREENKNSTSIIPSSNTSSSALRLDFLVSENGSNLSAGQCAQLCLARALLRRSRIVVLDEATASMDIESDAAVQNVIRCSRDAVDTVWSHATMIIIAHRFNTIMDCDRILVLQDGTLVENADPCTLLDQQPTSIFARMVDDTGPASSLLLRRMAHAAAKGDTRQFATLCRQHSQEHSKINI